MNVSWKIGCAACACLVAALPAAAEETKQETRLDEVVVTATRTEKTLASVPATVSVITRKDLEMRNVQSLDGALKGVPGLYSRREQEFSTLQPVINIRGIAGQNRILVMVDGITLNEPRTGAGYFDGISADDVERIEVVKGPFSSLYGGYAMGGVINVLTKMPMKREMTLKSGYGNAWTNGQGFDRLYSEYISYGDRVADKLSLLVSYGRKWTAGYPYQQNVQTAQPTTGITGYDTTTTSTGAKAYLIGDKGNGTSWYDDITVKTLYDITGTTKIGFTFLRNNYRTSYDSPNSYLTNNSGAPVFSYGTVREASFLATESGRARNIYNLNIETELGPVKTKLSASLVDQETSFNRSPGSTAATTGTGGPGTYSESPAKEYSVDLQFSAPIFAGQVLTWGGTFKNDSADSITSNLSNWLNSDTKTSVASTAGGASTTYSLFAQDEMQLFDNLTMYAGLRFDLWSIYDGYSQYGSTNFGTLTDRSESAVSPKLAFVYKPFPATTLRVSGGKAFRPPTIYELYSAYVGTYTTNPNPDLKPETSWSWDAGIEQILWHGAKIKAAYFENYLSDLIYTQGSGTIRNRVNVGKAESSGVEVELEQRFDTWLRLFGDYTYTHATITENTDTPSMVGKQMTDVPRHMFNLGVEANHGAASGSLVGRYVGKRFGNADNTDTANNVYGSYDEFLTADAKVAYTIEKLVTLSLAVNNIFDERYYTYYKSPGRSWFMEAAVKF